MQQVHPEVDTASSVILYFPTEPRCALWRVLVARALIDRFDVEVVADDVLEVRRELRDAFSQALIAGHLGFRGSKSDLGFRG